MISELLLIYISRLQTKLQKLSEFKLIREYRDVTVCH